MNATLIGNARMYAVAPGAAAAWRALLTEVGERAAVAFAIIDHAFPATLPELWARPDLGFAFMCGWPFALEAPERTAATPPRRPRPVLAAPVPNAGWSKGAPLYRSDFLVAAASPFRRIEDTFGTRFAYNALHSHSGFNMPRAHLAQWSAQAPLFSDLVGPLTTPRRCIEAVRDGAAEITAVDSYALQLLQRHDPDLAAGIRVLGSTAPSPIPPLVGSASLGDAERDRLRAALVGLHDDATGRDLLADLCLLRFAAVAPEAYNATLQVELLAEAAGYPVLR